MIRIGLFAAFAFTVIASGKCQFILFRFSRFVFVFFPFDSVINESVFILFLTKCYLNLLSSVTVGL